PCVSCAPLAPIVRVARFAASLDALNSVPPISPVATSAPVSANVSGPHDQPPASDHDGATEACPLSSQPPPIDARCGRPPRSVIVAPAAAAIVPVTDFLLASPVSLNSPSRLGFTSM